MPRKQRPRPVFERIDIERNVIERFLMQVKSYVKQNRKLVITSLLGLLAFIIIVIAAVVAVNMIIERDQKRFEKIMNDYAMYSMMGQKDKLPGIKSDLIKFVDSSYFGFPHTMAYYVLGNSYYDDKDYKKADEYLRIYARKDSSSIFAPLALIKAAVAREEMNDLKGALELYRELEDKYAASVIADQIFFNYARVYGKKNDLFNSKKYYTRVITLFPDSSFANLARKRLFMLGVR